MLIGTKAGGQALLGGLDCTVHRNFFGAQIRSFVTKLKAPACMQDFDPELEDFRAVFIRLVLILTAAHAAAMPHDRCVLGLRCTVAGKTWSEHCFGRICRARQAAAR